MADDSPPHDRPAADRPAAGSPDDVPPGRRRQARRPAERPTLERLADAYFGTCRKLATAITRLKERAK